MATNSNMLWVDKHRPKDLAKLDYHDALTKQLSTIAKSGNMPHMLFYGPSGAGKKTRIMALLKGIFGNAVYKLKLEQRSFKTPSKATVEVSQLPSTICHRHHRCHCHLWQMAVAVWGCVHSPQLLCFFCSFHFPLPVSFVVVCYFFFFFLPDHNAWVQPSH